MAGTILYMLRRALGVVALAASLGGCPREAAPPPPPIDGPIHAQPPSGDFTWSVGGQRHLLRAGAVSIGRGGGLDVVMADGEVGSPCDIVESSLVATAGPERAYFHVPRGLDVEYPLRRTISPDVVQLQPIDRKKAGAEADARIVPRYELELESLDLRPGGRVVGRIAWIGREPTAYGEGRFDLPLCASQRAIDELASLPGPRQLEPKGDVQGATLTGPFVAAHAFAVLRPWYGLPLHPTLLELYPDPTLACATRHDGKGTGILIDIDSGTGLGKHNGTRQPLGAIECRAGKTTWDCLGDPPDIRGFIEVRQLDLRVGGKLRGALAIEGENGVSIAGLIDVELCAE